MDVSARNICLRCVFGDDRATIAPDTWDVALFDNYPDLGGLEVTGGGYAPVSVAATTANFPVPTLGHIITAPLDYGTATGPWDRIGRVAVLRDTVGGTGLYYARPLLEDIVVTMAGQVVDDVRVVIDWNQKVLD